MRYLIGLGLALVLGCSSGGGSNECDGGPGGCDGEEWCVPAEYMCSNGEIAAIVPCCELPSPPDVTSACTGDESLVNPTSCTETGTVVTHQLKLMEILGDCNDGYDLDACVGTICEAGGLAPGEGVDGVDNALAGLAPVLAQVEANLDGVNQALSDSLCGIGGEECADELVPYDLRFAVDTNAEEGCANVSLLFDGEEASSVILNLGTPNDDGNVCASGTLGILPLKLAGEDYALGNAVIQMTIAPAEGFARGRLGATVDGNTAVAIAELIEEGIGPVVGQVFDITNDLEPAEVCDAISSTFEIGGVVEQVD